MAYSYMRPLEYLWLYHGLSVPDPVSGAEWELEVTGYGSGWASDANCNRKTLKPHWTQTNVTAIQTELNQLLTPALRMLHHGDRVNGCGTRFVLGNVGHAGWDPTEPFYAMSLIRAFNGKGSPDEIRDALRLARLVGRIGSGLDTGGAYAASAHLQDYATAFVTLDCNGLTGNYYGINPDTPPSAYTAATRHRRSVAEIQTGDALVTLNALGVWEHIALIEQCKPVPGTTNRAWIEIVEWGDAGGEGAHHAVPDFSDASHAKTFGPYNASRGLGYATDGNKVRYVYAPPQRPSPRSWGLNGNDAA